MSLLSNTIGTTITSAGLKEAGFIKSGWGAPDNRKRRHLNKWDISHHFWEYVSVKHDPKYAIIIWYFPEEFDGYVTEFNWNGKSAAGNIYITLDRNSYSSLGNINWCYTMEANDMLDIDNAIGIAIAKINELNNK